MKKATLYVSLTTAWRFFFS